jgi:hypothetical protein
MGHTIDNCSRDPNLKTKEDVNDDFARINLMKDCKKLFADTAVTTTLLLKKCVRVPKLELKDDAMHPDGLTFNDFNRETAMQFTKPFQRGAMSFDDYNYDQFNKYILVDPHRDETAADAVDLGGFIP